MDIEDFPNVEAIDLAPKPARKPRIAVMGEFSAGKSTLSNLLIGKPALPVRVTATQLPPVWISHGDAPPLRIALDGSETPVDAPDFADVSVADTQYLRVFHKSDALGLFDLIDMPGISDPNMPSEVWERAMHLADAVIWCSHATQAWRQSEAAAWSTFPPELYDKSLLLLTRFDKITSDRDRQRLMRRIRHETGGLFRDVYPVSLVRALEAGGDREAWAASGAAAFAEALECLARELSGLPPRGSDQAADETAKLDAARGGPRAPKPLAAVAADTAPAWPDPNAVLPRRVTQVAALRTATRRPPRDGGADIVDFGRL